MPRKLLLKLPPAAEVREAICLLLLCAAMIFSVLNIGVHRLAEPRWEPINHGLSPDGKEYISISLAGMRVHDVETGRETQRVTWRSPWSDLWSGEVHADQLAHIAEGRDERNTNPNPWVATKETTEARVTLQVSESKRYVIGKFPAGYAVWWDRHSGNVCVHYFNEHLPLRCFVDERRNHFHFECLRIAKPLFQHNTSHLPEDASDTTYLGRTLDVIEFRLSDSQKMQETRDLRIGAPISGDYRRRLVSIDNSKALELQEWTDFPQGSPSRHTLAPTKGLEEIGDCRAERTENGVRLIEARKEGLYESHLAQSSSKPNLHPAKGATIELAPFQSRGVYLHSENGQESIVIEQFNGGVCDRFYKIESALRWRDQECQNSAGREIIRVANEVGRVDDLPQNKQSEAISRRLRITPYPTAFALSLGSVVAAFAIWLAHTRATSTTLAGNGWLICLMACAWPMHCWLADLAMSLQSARIVFAGECGVALSLCAACMFLRGFVLRPCILATAIAVTLLLICILTSNQPT